MAEPKVTQEEFINTVDEIVKEEIREWVNTGPNFSGAEPNEILDYTAPIEDRDHGDFVDEYNVAIEEYCPDIEPNLGDNERLQDYLRGGRLRQRDFIDIIDYTRELLLIRFMRERAKALVEGGEWDAVVEKEETVTEAVQVGDSEQTVEGSETYYVLEE